MSSNCACIMLSLRSIPVSTGGKTCQGRNHMEESEGRDNISTVLKGQLQAMGV